MRHAELLQIKLPSAGYRWVSFVRDQEVVIVVIAADALPHKTLFPEVRAPERSRKQGHLISDAFAVYKLKRTYDTRSACQSRKYSRIGGI
jgi:hypothetical protein